MKKRMQALRIWVLLWLTLSALQAQTASYQVYGEGKPVLLLAEDGSIANSELTDKLTAHSFQVIVPEINTCREALLQSNSLSDDQLAMQLMTIATRLSRKPIAVVGCGAHTAMACRIAQLYPSQVDRIVTFGEKINTPLPCPIRQVSEGKQAWKAIESYLQADLKTLLTEGKTQDMKKKRILFDLSHSQCTDTFKGYETYPYLLPAYERMLQELDYPAELVIHEQGELTEELLAEADVVLMLSPLNKGLQKNLTEEERKNLVRYVAEGGSLLFFIDDAHRVDWQAYGAADVVGPYGISFGADVPLPGNVGAIAFPNRIFKERYEIPYSGACLMRGGEPVSVCMEGGYLHGTIVELANGGKLYVGGDTMVGLLLGYVDGERLNFDKMATRWWGKDSWNYMKALLNWAH